MKEITIRYKTREEHKNDMKHGDHSIIQVLFDGIPVERLNRFSVVVDPSLPHPVYTLEKYMEN